MKPLSQRIIVPGIVIIAVIALGAFLYFGGFTAKQVQEKPKVIGIVGHLPIMDPVYKGFVEVMGELGYVEGKDVVYEYLRAEGDVSKLPEFTRRFVNERVDIIMPTSLTSTKAVLKTVEEMGGTDIPIVFTNVNNPVEQGIVASFLSSGNNLTGVVTDFSNAVPKKLEFLKMIDPSIKKVAIFPAKFSDPAADFMFAKIREEAPKFDITLVEYYLNQPPGPLGLAEIKSVFATIKPGDIDALFQMPGPVVSIPPALDLFITFTKERKIPGVFLLDQQTEAGGLFSYGYSMYDVGRQVAPYVDKVLKGARPTDLPLEYQAKNWLYINLKTAEESGVTIPQSLISIADKVIR